MHWFLHWVDSLSKCLSIMRSLESFIIESPLNIHTSAEDAISFCLLSTLLCVWNTSEYNESACDNIEYSRRWFDNRSWLHVTAAAAVSSCHRSPLPKGILCKHMSLQTMVVDFSQRECCGVHAHVWIHICMYRFTYNIYTWIHRVT